MFDTIVVGARCAGSPLATLLARRGLRVCLVDRTDFPSDTPSTHGIQPPGVKVLAELGVLDELLAMAPAIDEGFIAFDQHRIRYPGITEVLGAPMVNARRVTLDAILVEAAAAAGADVRTRTTVRGLVEEGGRVVGVETTAGRLLAPLVVGADGARSTVARLLAAPEYYRTPAQRIFLWAYFEGVDPGERRVWLGSIGDSGFLASPTDAGLFLAALVAPAGRRTEARADRARVFADGTGRWPELRDVIAPARMVGPVRMMSRWHGFFRQSAGPGWALAGDAGHFKDPTPGQGISDALCQVAALAPAIARALDGTGGDRDLYHWWRWRDRESWEMYWFAQEMGSADRAPLIAAALGERLASRPDLMTRLLRVLGRDLSASQFLPPAAAASLIATTLRQNPGRRGAVAREAATLLGEELRRSALRASGLRRPSYRPTTENAINSLHL
jgi:2-polyprenyl-6-methoxyphenol hydroxylase-like FAD-dependent oxidoreductase